MSCLIEVGPPIVIASDSLSKKIWGPIEIIPIPRILFLVCGVNTNLNEIRLRRVILVDELCIFHAIALSEIVTRWISVYLVTRRSLTFLYSSITLLENSKVSSA